MPIYFIFIKRKQKRKSRDSARDKQEMDIRLVIQLMFVVIYKVIQVLSDYGFIYNFLKQCFNHENTHRRGTIACISRLFFFTN